MPRRSAANAIALPGDVGSEEDVKRIVAGAVEAYGPIDVLVNNAALATYEAVTRHFLEGDTRVVEPDHPDQPDERLPVLATRSR